MRDPSADVFGLPPCLHIPIAATNVDALTTYVGTVVDLVRARSGRINAVSVRPHSLDAPRRADVQLWQQPAAQFYEGQLHPPLQVWVHVDFAQYRQAYSTFGAPQFPKAWFLDHVQNREAIRLRAYSHPLLRLCPVPRVVNTSGGHESGGEGMEKEMLRGLDGMSAGVQAVVREAVARSQIVYADPMDLTKMIGIAPGTCVLDGVRDTQAWFYP